MDLSLTPGASAEDINKQSRKLGRTIQTANDILSDSQWRLKYDTDRLYTGYGKLHGPPKFNSPKALTKYYPASSSAKP
ncbi:unnamed protein product [Aspergillus oryzae]|uniref:Unnamed protein product n=1 Tax=Aspergillus oryzae TaxID=5062 RepID=A0AAN4YQL5_ASPOZ|nr:unnamed protein product [Aspergillus oryzae]